MSGQAGARGYLLQALACVLDGLDANATWTTVTIEPNGESEQVDILWISNDSRKAVQVKTSHNSISRPAAEAWAAALERSTNADTYELRLFGPCSRALAQLTRIGAVSVPTPELANIGSLIQRAAHKLDLYLTSNLPSLRLSPSCRELIVEALSNRLGSLSTKGDPLSRQQLNALLLQWARDSSSEFASQEAEANVTDIDSYLGRLRDYVADLPLLVDTLFQGEDAIATSHDVIKALRCGEHCQIVGPSGYGKSNLIFHMAHSAATSGTLPILCKATQYCGDLSGLLNRAVAPFCACSASALISAAIQAGHSLILVVDGFNECPAALRERLLLDLQASTLRWQLPVILTSQSKISLPPELAGRVFSACELEDSHRAMLLDTYRTGPLPPNALQLCSAFRSAYEVSIAATCISHVGDSPNRATLFDAYIRTRCRERVDAPLLQRVLTGIAGVMRMQLRSALPLVDAERVALSLLEQQRASVTTFQAIIETGLVEVNSGFITFRHELLQRYFEALDLRRVAIDANSLLTELLAPTHHILIDFCLELERDDDTLLSLLRATSSIGVASDRLMDGLQGRFGRTTAAALRQDVARLFELAHEEVRDVSIALVPIADGKPERHFLEVHGQREWSRFDESLWEAIRQRLCYGEFLNEALQLAAQTERTLSGRLLLQLGPEALQKASVKSRIFSDLFVSGTATSLLPVRRLTGRSGFRRDGQAGLAATERMVEALSRETPVADIELYLLLIVGLPRTSDMEALLPALCVRGWGSEVFHLRCEVLEYLQTWAYPSVDEVAISDASRSLVELFLSSIETSDIFLNTIVIETMNMFEMIDLGLSVDDVGGHLIDLVACPEDEIKCRAAATAVLSTFEDLYGNVYYDAIERLTPEHQMRLYSMAALGVDPDSLSASYILEKLIRSPTSEAMTAFIRFTSYFNGESVFPQGATECFALAHIGSAHLIGRPLVLSDLSTNDRRAWQCYGELLFWSERRNAFAEDVDCHFQRIWASLSNELRDAAVDPLMRFASASGRRLDGSSENLFARFFSTFRLSICDLLQRALPDHARLTGIDKRWADPIAVRERTSFVIDTLGQVGGASAVEVLARFIEDSRFGEAAVAAIRSINSGNRSNRIQLIRRS